MGRSPAVGAGGVTGGDGNIFVRRVAAYWLDCTLLFLVLAPISFGAQRLLGVSPATGPGIWLTLLISFSIPTWTYFAVSDASARGATIGKRVLGIRVASTAPRPITFARAMARTAVKLLPWELTHVSAFALSRRPDALSAVQVAGIATAIVIVVAYLVAAFRSSGRSSIHDSLAATAVVSASPTSRK